MRIPRPDRCRPARRPPARRSASSPMRWSARPSSMRSTAANPDLAALPMYCVVTAVKDPLRHEGHADHGEQRRRLRDGCAAVRRDARRAAACQGRDHLREVGRARIQRRPGRSGRAGEAETNLVAGGAGHERVERAGLQSVRHRASAARIEQRLGCRDRGQPGDDRHLRAVGRVVPGSGVAQRRRTDADDQGIACPTTAASATSGSSIVPAFTPARSATRRRCSMPSRIRNAATTIRAIRSRRCPKALMSAQPYASFCDRRRRAQAEAEAAAGMRIAILREHMVKKTHEPRGDLRPDRQRDQDRAARPARRRARRDDHAGLSRRSGRAEPEVHVRRRAVRTAAADDAGDLSRARRQGRAVVRRAGPRRHVVRLPAEAEQAPGAADRPDQHHQLQLRSPSRALLIGELRRRRRSTSTATWSIAATRRSRTGPHWVANAKFREDDVARRRGELARAEGSRCGGQERSARAQLHRAAGAAARDVRERHRRVRASREHGADAEDPGAERRRDQPRRHHALLPDSARGGPGGHDRRRSTSRSTR